MAFNYSPSSSRSAFGGGMSGFQLLLSGLPLDVKEKDVRDLLLSEPMSLPALTTRVQALHNLEGSFLGMALIQVGSEEAAERVRKEYSGQTIDSTFQLAVQHLLPPTLPLPSRAALIAATEPVPPAAAQKIQQRQQAAGTQVLGNVAPLAPRGPAAAKGKAPTPPSVGAGGKKTVGGKPEGLQLLARIRGKQGQGQPLTPKERQIALLAQQKLAGKPGQLLMSRLAKSHPTHSSKPKAAIATGKVNRAKVAATQGAKMDVDKPVKPTAPAAKPKAPERAKPKTQAELDEEMRLYDRARRFAPA